MVLFCVLMALAAGFAYVQTATPIYTSTAKLWLDYTGPRVPGIYAAGATPETTTYLNTQAGIIRSGPILSSVAESLAPRRLRTFSGIGALNTYLKTHMRVEVGRQDEIVSVSFRSAYPSEAAEIVNCVVDTYMTSRSQHEQKSSVQVLKILQEELSQAGEELQKKRDALMDFQTSGTAMFRGADQGEGIMRGYLEVQEAYIQATLRVLDADGLLKSIRALSGDPVALRRYVRSRENTSTSADADREQAPLETRMVDLELEQGNALETFTPDHPTVAQKVGEIERIKAKLAEWDDRFVKAVTDAAEQQYAEAKARLEGIAPLLEEREKQVRALNVEAAQFQWLKSDVDMLMAHRQTLEEKVRQIQTIVDEDVGQLRMAVLEPATAAEIPSAPQKAKIMAAVLMLGLLLGGTIACLKEWHNQNLRSTEEISTLLRVPVLGIIPAMSRRHRVTGRGQRVCLKPYSQEAEAFRTVRTALFFGASNGSVKTLLITSPSRRDGKSTLVSNLAIAMAHAGQKTLILDADFRKPVQHTIFGVDHREQCLGSVLAGTMELGAAIQPTRVEGLHLLTCGHNVSHPAEVLGSSEFAGVLHRLAQEYDRILIDAPPVILVTDAQIIGALSDATLLVVKADKCTGRAAQRAKNVLQRVGARLLGVVVNDVHKAGDCYGYYPGQYRRRRHPKLDEAHRSKRKEMVVTTAPPASLTD
jgi:capsular exopolysaccharide synthesis family protein